MSEYKGRSAAELHQVWRGRVTLVARVQDSTLGEEQRYFPPKKEETVQSPAILCSQLWEDLSRGGWIRDALTFSLGEGGISEMLGYVLTSERACQDLSGGKTNTGVGKDWR